MKTLELGEMELQFDPQQNSSFYSKQVGFSCDCPYCLNFVEEVESVKKLMNGLDETLGIDLSKDVGQGMDELMAHDYKDHCLYVAPYYLSGTCKVKGETLEIQSNGPIWSNTIRAEHRINENLSLTIINTTNSISIDNANSVLTLWVEFKSSFVAK